LIDLSHSTSYEFYVRTYCGGNPSGWSLPGEFTTECGSVEISFLSPDESQTYDFSISNQIPYSFEYLGCEEFYLNLKLYDEEENNGWDVTGDWYNKSITVSDIYSAPATLPSGTYKFRMEYWYNEQTNYVYSNEFEVVNNVPVIEVTEPGSWSYWNTGISYGISWNSLNVSGVNLSYSLDNGSTWNSIENNVASQNGSNYYTFEVPVSINGHFEQSIIRIEDASNSSVVDYSDQFTLTNIPPLTIIEPNALSYVEILGEMDIVIENEFESWIHFYVIDNENNWIFIGEQDFSTGQSSFIYSTNSFEVGKTYRIEAYHYNKNYEVYSEYFTVSKATPTVTEWPTASGLTYGDALSASNLTGGYAEHNGIEVAGVFTFDSPTYEPGAGPYLANVTFTPTDGEIFSTVSGTVEVTVEKAEPVI
nr:hypothetical protein [Tenuifilaceae bacterium]